MWCVNIVGLTDPVLMRLDVDSKLSEQLKVSKFIIVIIIIIIIVCTLHCHSLEYCGI